MGAIDKKKLADLMKSMGGIQASKEQMKMMNDLSSKYGTKNEEELKSEMKKLKEEMMKDEKKFKQQMEAVALLKDFLDEDQKKRLENIMEFLNNEEEE